MSSLTHQTMEQNLSKLFSETLETARMSIDEMDEALADLKAAKDSLNAVEQLTQDVAMLATNLRQIREESQRHTQLSTTNDNFKHIFNVPQIISNTRELIREGKLLHAHQQIFELDRSRYAILYEMHRNPSSNPNDRITLKAYFSDVDKLSEELGKQLWLIVRRTLTYVRREPQKVVSALRIIEREEKMDEMALKRCETTGFMPPGRPRQWRKRVFDILEEAVAERLTANQFETRNDNKLWLVRHLEVTRLMMIEDLHIVNVACVQCFPPSYRISNLMLKLYHTCLRSHLLDLSHHLEGNEYIHLLNWIQTYTGRELLGHPKLAIDVNREGLDPLLPDSNKQELTDRYFATIEKNYREWMSNTINREERDWSSPEPPEMDNDGHYHTTTPVFIFQMIDQHLRVAETVNQALEDRILDLSMDQLILFAQQYRETIEKYCKIHFSDRGRYKFFTPYMVAITNNCLRIKQLFLNMENSRPSAVNAFEALRDETIEKLLKELFLDVSKEINQIGSQEWIDGKVSCIENICLTLDDYYEDYKHLRRENRRLLYQKLSYRMARDYTRALLMRKTNLGNQRHRQLFCDKFMREGRKLEEKIDPERIVASQEFGDSTNATSQRSPFQPLGDIKEFLQLRDPDLLALEVQNLKRRYPDMNEVHLSALLLMSDIIPRRECLREAKRMLEAGGAPTDLEKTTIFSEIQLPS